MRLARWLLALGACHLQQSKFITIRGLTITGAGGEAIALMGDNNQNTAIHLERTRIFGNGSGSCNGGITIARGNLNTLIVNNLIYGNGRNGITFIDADGGPHQLIENTIHGNAWSGVNVAREHQVLRVFLAVLTGILLWEQGALYASEVENRRSVMKVYLIPFAIETYVPVTMSEIEAKSHYAVLFIKTHPFVSDLRRWLKQQPSARSIDNRVIRLKAQFDSEIFFVDQDGVVFEQLSGLSFQLSKARRVEIERRVREFSGVIDLKLDPKSNPQNR